jgi:hypothetical protein
MAEASGHFRGEGGVVFEMDLPLSEIMAEKITKGYLVRVNADGSPYAEQDPVRRPAQSAPKAEWVGYAVRVYGMTPDDAEALNKADLIDRYGRTDPPASTPPPASDDPDAGAGPDRAAE